MTNPLNITKAALYDSLRYHDDMDIEYMSNIRDEDMIEHLYELLESHDELSVRINPDHTDNLAFIAIPAPMYDDSENDILILATYAQTEYDPNAGSTAVWAVALRFTDEKGWIVVSNAEVL